VASHVQSKSLFGASSVAESSATVVIRSLRPESDTASDLSVGPNFTLERFDGEDLILEQHWVIVNSLPDALILSLKGGNGLLLVPLSFELKFILVIRIITVKGLLIRTVEVLRLHNLSFLGLFLNQLLVKSRLLLILFFFSRKSAPRELNRYLRLVHDCVVLVTVQSDRRGIHMDVTLRQKYVVVMTLSHDRYNGLEIIIVECHLILVSLSFLWDELEDELLGLTYLKDAFSLV
jgi:hypothetical protein